MNHRAQIRRLLLATFVAVLFTSAPSIGQQVKIGEPAPDFAVPSLDGQRTIHLSDFRGRRVLIFAWASW